MKKFYCSEYIDFDLYVSEFIPGTIAYVHDREEDKWFKGELDTALIDRSDAYTLKELKKSADYDGAFIVSGNNGPFYAYVSIAVEDECDEPDIYVKEVC